MTEMTISEAMPNSSPMVVLGAGALTANALAAAGQISTSMTMVEPTSGSVSPAVTVEQKLSAPDPSVQLQMAPNTPANLMGISTPSGMGMKGPG